MKNVARLQHPTLLWMNAYGSEDDLSHNDSPKKVQKRLLWHNIHLFVLLIQQNNCRK